MKMQVSEKSLIVLNFLKENHGKKMTAADIAEALGMEKKSVDGIVTSGLQKKGYAERIPAQVEVTDAEGNAKYQDVKFIQATEAGLAYNDEAAKAADEAAKDAE